MSRSLKDLSVDDVLSQLTYDPETGIFMWKSQGRNGRRKLGVDATTSNGQGYRRLSINGKPYLAHRVAWLIVHGRPPNGFLDHIDGDKTNNAIANLREVSPMDNAHNIFKPYRTNSSGLLGVYYCKTNKRWRGEIIANKRRYRLGWFKTKEEAHAAYIGAKSLLHKSATIAKDVETDLSVADLGDGTPSTGGWRPKDESAT